MSDDLLNCAHCDSQPRFIANRFEAVIACTGCGITTPPQSLDASRDQAFTVLRGIWNTRVRPRPTEQHELSAIIRKELSTSDLGTVLALIARNEDNWTERGPLFAALATKLLQPEPMLQELIPAETLLKDACRYRKLMRRARVIQIDGRPWIHIEPIDALTATVSEEVSGGTLILEEFLARVLDCTDEYADTLASPLGRKKPAA
ncbi:hypothetical protein [Cupriavidus basilensis]|jgi:hypothetical protein|uniref:hypothetical protein n=1 Tax=Cupriavidus basilensis TaxID=68895 RepID=UPI0023E87B75|nr:hypothetical protein [Cupriavidus basilensis]MDF3882665.1 hypothetical protein [Cupriavidus basilensis]